MTTSDLTDAQWDRLRPGPLLPPQNPPTGRPADGHRAVIDGSCGSTARGAASSSATAPGGPFPAASIGAMLTIAALLFWL